MPAYAERCTSRYSSYTIHPLVEEPDDLAGNVFPSCLLVVHDTSRCGQNDVAELTRWQKLDDPLLKITELDIVSWRNDAGLIEPAVELNDNLAIAVVINLLEFTDVTWWMR